MGLNRKVLSSPGGGIALRLMRAIEVSIRSIGEPDKRFSKRDYVDCFFRGSPEGFFQKNMIRILQSMFDVFQEVMFVISFGKTGMENLQSNGWKILCFFMCGRRPHYGKDIRTI